jgi:hypothetical protein
MKVLLADEALSARTRIAACGFASPFWKSRCEAASGGIDTRGVSTGMIREKKLAIRDRE